MEAEIVSDRIVKAWVAKTAWFGTRKTDSVQYKEGGKGGEIIRQEYHLTGIPSDRTGEDKYVRAREVGQDGGGLIVRCCVENFPTSKVL